MPQETCFSLPLLIIYLCRYATIYLSTGTGPVLFLGDSFSFRRPYWFVFWSYVSSAKCKASDGKLKQWRTAGGYCHPGRSTRVAGLQMRESGAAPSGLLPAAERRKLGQNFASVASSSVPDPCHFWDGSAVLRIRDVYPGSRIRTVFIPDPGSA